MKRMEEDNSWVGDPDDFELDTKIEAMKLQVFPHGLVEKRTCQW